MPHRPRSLSLARHGLGVILLVSVAALFSDAIPLIAQNKTSAFDPSWLHLYVRNRRHAVALATADELAKSGRTAEFIAQIQWLFDQPGDSWLVDRSGQLTSIADATSRLFAAQDKAVFDQYRRTVGPNAALELARVTSNYDASELMAIARRYPATDAGLSAIDRLVSRWLDEGAWERAAELGLSVVRENRLAALAPPDLVRRTWLACRLTGREADAAGIAEQFAGAEWLQRDPGEMVEATAAGVWIGPGGNARRNAQVSVTPPLLESQWQQPLESPAAYPNAGSNMNTWQNSLRERDQPTAVGWAPVLNDHQVVFRDLDSIVGVDNRTGAVVWRHRTKSGLASILSQSLNDQSMARRMESQRWEAAVGNSLLGSLATDGRRVYAIDDYESFLQGAMGGTTAPDPGSANRRSAARNALIALDLSGDENRRVVWSTAQDALKTVWAGHAFLGAPLPFEGWLYVISEVDRELLLSAIDPLTGRPFWQQPIAEVERSVVEDRGRYLRVCTPTVADGLVLCPTNIGLLVAVDALSGRLRWVHQSLPAEENEQRNPFAARMRTTSNIVQRHHPGFAPLISVQGDRAVYLPSHLPQVFCLSVPDGKVLWNTAIPEAECLGAVTDTVVLVIGKMQCRGLSLADGSEIWKRPLPAPPTGYGLSRGDTYLLPLADGQMAQLDLQRGELVGYGFRTAREPLGHLVATSDAILSVGSAGVTAYPQTASLRQRLLAEQRDDAATKLRLAEIQFVEGDLTGAIRQLESLHGGSEPKAIVQQSEDLLRRAYSRALIDDPADIDKWLEKLKPLSRTPHDRLSWLVAASERAASQERFSQVATLLTDIAALSKDAGIVNVPGESDWAVSSRVWLRLLSARPDDEEVRKVLHRDLTAVANPEQDDAAAAAVAYALDGSSWASLARRHQAESAIAQSDWHRAESLLLRDGKRAEAAASVIRLAKLYQSAGLMAAAGRTLDLVDSQVSDEALNNGALLAWRRRQPLAKPVDHVVIRPQPGSELALGRRSLDMVAASVPDDRYDGFHRSVFTPLKPDAPLDWLYQPRDLQAVYGVFDRASAQKLVEFELPLGAQPPNSFLSTTGSGLAFGLPAELRMLSPLAGRESGRAWSTSLAEWAGRSAQPIIGPWTSRFVLMQMKSDLLAVDTADGQILWRRSGLPTGSGLMGNVRNGLSADDGYVVMLEAGAQPTCRVYESHTGKLRRQGRAPTGITSPLAPVRGRLHIFRTADALPRLQVWDPATDELVVDQALHSSTRQLIDAANLGHVAWLAKGNRLCVYDLNDRRMAIDLALTEKDLERVTSIRTFRQRGRFYVTLQSDQPTAHTEHFHAPLPQDSFISVVPIRDEFLAIDPATQQILWRQPQPQGSVVQWGDLPVPVLVTVSMMRHRTNQNRRWLQIQAYDPDTGRRLGDGGELPIDAIIAADYDGITGTIRLLARRTTYELQLRTAPVSDAEPPTL